MNESCPACGYYKRGEDGTCVQCFAEWPHSQHPAPGCLQCEDDLAEAREVSAELDAARDLELATEAEEEAHRFPDDT